MKKKLGIIIGGALFIAAIIIFLVWYLGQGGKEAFVALTAAEKKIEAEKLAKSGSVAKKHKGKEGDITPTTISSITLSGLVLNLEKGENLKLLMNLSDESGIYRIRVHFYHQGKPIGYMQQNPNTKDKNVSAVFNIDGKVILDELKTFLDYEGGDITYSVSIWDNNMVLKEYKAEKGFYVYDNIAPEKMKAYWTVFYNEKEYDIEIYTNKLKTAFDVYRVNDLPLLEVNKIVKYEYGYSELAGGKLMLRVGMDSFEEEKKTIEIACEKEGKFQFFIRGFDKKGNVSEKKIKFHIDTTPPQGNISIVEGGEFYLGETVSLSMNATDNLSGVARYRLAGSENDIYNADWKPYKEVAAQFKVPYQEGFYAVWAQLEDNAFNISKPFKIDYYAKQKTTIDINAVEKNREKVIGIDRDKMESGTIEIKKLEER